MSSIVRGVEGAFQFEHGDGMPLGHELAAAYAMEPLDRINEETANLKGALNTFLSHEDTVHIADSINANHLLSPVAAIGGKILHWFARASDDELLEFSVANAKHHAQQSGRLRDMEPQLREDMLARAERLHKIGYLPAYARNVYHRADIEVLALRRMDFFEAGAMAASGYRQFGSHAITLADQFLGQNGGPTTGMCDTVLHEFTHVAGEISGGFVAPEAPPDDLVFVEEAIVSHTTQISDNIYKPMPYVLDPDVRNEVKQGSYTDVRTLVSILARSASRPLLVSDMTEAFFTPPTMGVQARMHVQLRLDRAIRELLPAYNGTGLRGFSQDYNRHHERNTAPDWVDQQIRAASGVGVPSAPAKSPAHLSVTNRAILTGLS